MLLGSLATTCFLARSEETGSVSGVVVSTWDGTTLPAVTVTLRGTTLATQTDATGRYELKNVPPGDQVLRFSKSGFASAVVTDVRVLAGQTTTVNGNLRPEFYEMEEYEVTAEEFTEQTEKILIERQQASSLLDAIGSEQFSKLGAGDAGQIVARVTGVSLVGGKYAVVRGLSDRYTRTLLNGVEIPSSDPYRMSPQLDLFPSAMIDRVAVTKTFTPDQPGGTGGGTIDIITKSFPEEPFLKGTLGISYNPNSNLKNNFLADPGSSMSMIAFPTGPAALSQDLFGLTEAPRRPGPAGSRETAASATVRREQADSVAGLLQNLGTANFAGVPKSSPLNSSFTASGGETLPLFEHNLGLFGGVNYSRNFHLIEDATINRYNYNASPHRLGRETRGNIDTDYGANVNLGYDLSPYAQLGFNFMLAHSTDEEARHGTFNFNEGQEESLERWQLHFTDREILNYQLYGHHDLPFLAASKIDWVVALANTTQNEPDHRFMNYFVDSDGRATFGDASTPFPQHPARYFREIEEQGLNYRVDWTLPLPFLNQDSKLKTGFFSSSTDRGFKEQLFAYDLSSGFDLNRPNTYLNDPLYLQYLATYVGNTAGGIGRTNYSFARYIRDTFAHPYTASLNVQAGYLMGDFGVLPWLRLIGGARFEKTLMNLDAGREGTSKIDQTDMLPAASAVVSFRTNFDLRLSYGETVSRPSFREIAPVLSYLPDLGVTALGNPNLQMISIKSYDLRLEWYPAPGDVLTAGFFYKQVERPIELTSRSADDEQVTWINRANEPASLLGVEFEARKSLEFLGSYLKGLTIGANVTLIQSTTKLSETELANKRSVEPSASDTRPLFDQSPYIINLDLSYEHPTSGTSFVIGANLTGERLVLVKTLGPDIYEHPPIGLDAAIGQRFWKLNGLSFAAVGRGTTVEFVESYCAADDGFEFFGGTVNTKYLVSAFNDDDSFDTDMGYSGTNQFWFAIQAPDKRNYGMELNNQVNERPQDVQRTPASDFKVYNMTIIGAGALDTTPPNGGEDAAVTLRPWVGPKIYNAIFTDFNGRGILLDTQNGITATQAVTGGYAQFHNTLWWDFVTGSGNGIISNTATNLGRGTVATNYWTDLTLNNQIVNPLLTSISRTNVGAFLDPRPKAGSLAYSNYAARPNSLASATYQGAFSSGRGDWISDWTALSEYSIVGGAGGTNPQTTAVTAPLIPIQPALILRQNGTNLNIAFTLQTGLSYQLQSTTNFSVGPIDWVTEGNPISGTGGTATITVPTSLNAKFFRVQVK